MRAAHITASRREEWNAFLARQPSFALLQSWEWGEFKEKLGWKVFRVVVERQSQIVAGAQVLIKVLPLGPIGVAYIPRGPVGDWLDEEVALQLLPELHRLAIYHKATFLKIEPPVLNDPAIHRVLRQHHFRASAYTNQPHATIILDLTQNLDDILEQMRKKTRQYVRLAARIGVTVREGNGTEFSAFYDLMQATGRRGGFSLRSRDYYKYEWQTIAANDQSVLLMAFYQNRLVAMRMAYCFGEHAAEFHAGSSDEHRDLRPSYLLVWEAIKWAKAQGCATYDLWGIPDQVGQAVYAGNDPPVSNRTDGLWGVYRFKSGFSKNIVYYMGAYDYVYSPCLYKLIANKFLNVDTLDQIAVWMDSLRHS